MTSWSIGSVEFLLGSYVSASQVCRPAIGPGHPRFDKARRRVTGRLQTTKVSPQGGKGKGDFFLWEYAEIKLPARDEDVQFFVAQGVAPTSLAVTSYLAGNSETSRRDWNVFARYKSQTAADAAQIRQEYDNLLAYREQLARLYQARTTRRC